MRWGFLNNKTEKPNVLHIAITAFITTFISLSMSLVAQWLSLESVVITVSPSSELEGKYLTTISVQNLKESTLSNLSLYFDTDFDILEIKSSDEFEHRQQYVEIESISPKAKYSVIVWTDQPIVKGQIIAESDYKTRLDYSNDNSPFLIQMLWFIIPFSFVTFLSTGIQIWIGWKRQINESQKRQIRYDELQAETRSQEDKIKRIQEHSDELFRQYTQQEKDIKELRLYYRTCISQLRKELSFWRDTVRKMLYDSQNEFQTADKVIETVTTTLKTYTTRKSSNKNMDELLYLAQLIADSRELHCKYNSPDSKNRT